MSISRNYDYAANTRLRPVLFQYIRGIQGPRLKPVTLKTIIGYFTGTPEKAIRAELDNLLTNGEVDIRRNSLGRNRSHYTHYYELTELGEQRFQSYVRNGACYLGVNRIERG